MSKHFNYKAQLDGLRAIAVFLVLTSHWLLDAKISNHFMHGRYGVDLFFVLSGFLLTSILIKQKEKGLELFKTIKGFFVKRALRLFPAYFFLLFGLLLINYLTGFWLWNDGFGIYYFTYTANFLFFFEGYQNQSLNHIWSLCVEEQFYLVLPWLVLLFSKKTNLVLFSLAILISLIAVSAFDGLHRIMVYGNLSTLGLGVLSAYYFEPIKKLLLNAKLRNALFIVLIPLAFFTGMVWVNAIHELVIALLFSLVVITANMDLDRAPWKLLNNGTLSYIGKISYGLYLYHRPIPNLLHAVLLRLDLELHPYVLFFTYFVLLFMISIFSFYIIEKPFMKLKNKFDY